MENTLYNGDCSSCKLKKNVKITKVSKYRKRGPSLKFFVKIVFQCQSNYTKMGPSLNFFVKTLQVCQNSAGQFCQNGAGSLVQNNFSRSRTRLYHHLSHTTNAFLIIERSKCVIKQSEDWLMPTVNPNVCIRDGTSLVNLLCLFCPLYSFVLLLPNNRQFFSKY